VAKISSKDMPICMKNSQLPFRRKKGNLNLSRVMSPIAVFETAAPEAHPVHEIIKVKKVKV
jgi:hypothetical protein